MSTSAPSPVASVSGPVLDRVVRGIQEIATLPHIALKIMEMAGDPNSGAADLKELIESDPALAARVLRCVNSSAYAVRTRITNLQQAIAYLGFKQIRNLAITASVGEMFKEQAKIGLYSRTGLWRHLVSVGVCARLIAMRLKMSNFEDMFLAGLLHDIGIILEDQHVHQGFCRVILALDGKRTLVDVEREQLEFDHTVLGERIAEQWGFPPAVRGAIRHHHQSGQYRGAEVNVVRCIEVANLLCTLKGMPSIGIKLVAFEPSLLGNLSLTKEDITVLAEDLDEALAANTGLFQI